MNKKEYDHVLEVFKKYYETFENPTYNMILKYEHSLNVADYMVKLAEKLKLSTSDIYLAKTIGLLHDIGRFEQLKEFNSFNDNLFNHAEFGVKYLFDDNHIRDFIDNDKNDSIIRVAILNHNKYKNNYKLKGKERVFSYMIRDMDKVDIYYQVATKYVPKFDKKPSKKVLDALYDGKCIYKDDIKNDSDKLVQMLGFLNDIHYKDSFEILKESDNLNYYLCSINVLDKYKDLFNEMINYCLNKAGMGDFNGTR